MRHSAPMTKIVAVLEEIKCARSSLVLDLAMMIWYLMDSPIHILHDSLLSLRQYDSIIDDVILMDIGKTDWC